MAKTQSLATGGRVLDVLLYLLRADYATGVSPLDIARAVGLTPSAVTRYLATLEERGCLERDPSNGRLRVSIRIGRHLYGLLRSAERMERRMAEARARLQTEVAE